MIVTTHCHVNQEKEIFLNLFNVTKKDITQRSKQRILDIHWNERNKESYGDWNHS